MEGIRQESDTISCSTTPARQPQPTTEPMAINRLEQHSGSLPPNLAAHKARRCGLQRHPTWLWILGGEAGKE